MIPCFAPVPNQVRGQTPPRTPDLGRRLPLLEFWLQIGHSDRCFYRRCRLNGPWFASTDPSCRETWAAAQISVSETCCGKNGATRDHHITRVRRCWFSFDNGLRLMQTF